MFVPMVRYIVFSSPLKPVTSGIPNQIRQVTGAEFVKTHKTRAAPEKTGTSGMPIYIEMFL
jgi:hypothetical protein